jgi:hypothetical protein
VTLSVKLNAGLPARGSDSRLEAEPPDDLFDVGIDTLMRSDAPLQRRVHFRSDRCCRGREAPAHCPRVPAKAAPERSPASGSGGPRSAAFLSGLRWQRTAWATTNLHHLLGFWTSIPLAQVSLTGVYLGFPQAARQLTSSVAPMTAQGQRPGFAAAPRCAADPRRRACRRPFLTTRRARGCHIPAHPSCEYFRARPRAGR